MRSTPSRRTTLAMRCTFHRSRSGFLTAAGKNCTSAPVSRSRCTSRPPSVRTMQWPPAECTASAISMVDSSAPPVSSSGMICSMVGRFSATCFPLAAKRFFRLSESEPQFLDLGPGETTPARRIAYRSDPALPGGTGLFWLSGYKSDMASTKATELAGFARANGYGYARFDYSGHGVSSGKFEDGTIGAWLEEAEAVFRRLTQGRQ